MFFVFPLILSLQYPLILLAAAVLPALYLMRYIYRLDRIEPEPPKLLRSLFITGIIAAFASMILEGIGESVLRLSAINPESPLYTILFAFLVVAAVEEGTKYYLMHRKAWNDPAFNFRFDAIVYSAFTSLGFAAIENVIYVFSYGLGTAVVRAILSVPGHLAFSVVFGTFYGRAKYLSNCGDASGARTYILIGYVCSVFLHGFYDACAMLESGLSSFAFVVFVIVMFIMIFRLVHSEADKDFPIHRL